MQVNRIKFEQNFSPVRKSVKNTDGTANYVRAVRNFAVFTDVLGQAPDLGRETAKTGPRCTRVLPDLM